MVTSIWSHVTFCGTWTNILRLINVMRLLDFVKVVSMFGCLKGVFILECIKAGLCVRVGLIVDFWFAGMWCWKSCWTVFKSDWLGCFKVWLTVVGLKTGLILDCLRVGLIFGLVVVLSYKCLLLYSLKLDRWTVVKQDLLFSCLQFKMIYWFVCVKVRLPFGLCCSSEQQVLPVFNMCQHRSVHTPASF